VGQHLAAHADAGVAHGELHPVAGARLGAALAVQVVQLQVAGLDTQGAAVGHGVAGVHRQVHDDLVDLGRIDEHRPEPLGKVKLEPHVLTD